MCVGFIEARWSKGCSWPELWPACITQLFFGERNKALWALPGCVLFSLKLSSAQAVSQGWEAHCSRSHHQHTSAS